MSSPPCDGNEILPGLGPCKGVPRMAAAVDWSRLLLDADKGFVLSRIDGRTSLHKILLISPFPKEKAVAMLIELFSRGVIEVPGVPRPPPPPAAAAPPPPPQPTLPGDAGTPPPAPAPPPSPPRTRSRTTETTPWRPPAADGTARPSPSPRTPLVPPAPSPSPSARAPLAPAPSLSASLAAKAPLVPPAPPAEVAAVAALPSPPPSAPVEPADPRELSAEAKRRIEDMLLLVGDEGYAPDPHKLLDVPLGADKKTIKRAYRELSKEFHPDRYFRKNLGEYARALQRVFNAIKEAYDVLDREATS